MARSSQQVRSFVAHPKLMLDIIRRQAGSLAKAVMEAAQNSADAILCDGRADGYCDIIITKELVTIKDNGRGITSQQQVKDFFDTFGQPHDEDENKTFGTFRMGRGQMFAFGRNLWKTGPFMMDVDVAAKGLEYHLTEIGGGKKGTPGCEIEIRLYKPLDDYDLNTTCGSLEDWLAYTPITVKLNGSKISRRPETEKWTYETDDAYVRLDAQGNYLRVFNMGVHVVDMSRYSIGTGGVVVSKKPFTVNFARNDIQHDCPVWGPVDKLIRKHVTEEAAKGKNLTDDQAAAVLRRATAGDVPTKFLDMLLLADTNGKKMSLNRMVDYAINRCAGRLSFAEKGDMVADRANTNRSCLVLDCKVLEHLRVASTGFLPKLREVYEKLNKHQYQLDRLCYVPFGDIADKVTTDFSILPPKSWTPTERLWLDLLDRLKACAFSREHFVKRIAADRATMGQNRTLVVGKSDVADAWTDGRTYIAFNRAKLASTPFTLAGFTDLLYILYHEMAHDDDTHNTHHHGVEFYERLEKLMRDGFPRSVSGVLQRLRTIAGNARRSAARIAKRDLTRVKTTSDELRQASFAMVKLAESLEVIEAREEGTLDSGGTPHEPVPADRSEDYQAVG